MDIQQIRSEVRGILQETLQYIIEEIDEEAVKDSVKLNRKRKWVKDKVKQDTNSYLLHELSVKGPTEHFKALRNYYDRRIILLATTKGRAVYTHNVPSQHE